MIEVEKAFSDTTRIVLGTELNGIDGYSKWLGRYVPLPHPTRSSISGSEVWLPPTLNYAGKKFNRSRVIDMAEMELPKSPFSAKDVENASVRQLVEKLCPPVAFFCGNFRYGNHENFEKVSGGGKGKNVYYSEDIFLDVKNVAFSNYVLYSTNIFGSHNVLNSQFCIGAFNSTAIMRCFEVEGCTSSSDLLFCHNCENVQDSMFCFNTKNLRHAIGNVQLDQESYRKAKGVVLAQIAEELKRTKSLKYSIFNIGGSHE